jgi:multiple sugar transport system ATP-binding protein
MNFLSLHSGLQRGTSRVGIGDATIDVPEIHEDLSPAELALGVRPEHVRFDTASKLRGQVLGAEYLGTTQIVVVDTPAGTLRARR